MSLKYKDVSSHVMWSIHLHLPKVGRSMQITVAHGGTQSVYVAGSIVSASSDISNHSKSSITPSFIQLIDISPYVEESTV